MFNPLNIFNRGLSKEEIAKTLKKIRSEYNNYIVTYMRSSKAKEEFEKRYYFAAKYRENMANFFNNEIKILKELLDREEEIIAEREREALLKKQRNDRLNGKGFADKVLKELEDRIKLYPEIKITDNASTEVRKLYGALRIFEDRYWNSLSRYIKMATPMGRMIDHLENDLWQLIGTENRLPPVLDKYIFLLERSEQDLKAISYAEQECLKQVSFFLNELLELYRVSTLEVDPPSKAVDGYNYASQLVFNFRLADIKNINSRGRT